MQAEQRSAVVFGARNLGRAVIELLVSDGWAVAGVRGRRPPSMASAHPARSHWRRT